MLTETTCFYLAIIACASLAGILYLHKTVLLGFTFACFCLISSASLSALIFGYIFDLDNDWISDEHLWVFTYSAIGLIAFNLGVLIAWKPLREQIREAGAGRGFKVATYLATTPLRAWLNSKFVVLCLGLAVTAYIIAPLTYGIPTFTAVWSNYLELLKLGILIALVLAKTRGTYQPLIISILVFCPLVVFQAVYTGFIGAGGIFLFQILLVVSFWNGLNLRSGLVFTIGFLLIFGLGVGWLNSRRLIRGEELTSKSQTRRTVEFVSEFDFTNPMSLTPDETQERLFFRFDMSDILSAQVYQQPDFEPYEYGKGIASDLAGILVPRFLWANKPARAGGSEYVSKYTGIEWEETSVDLPYQFHLYVNGGALLVILGLFGVGFFTAKVELSLFESSLTLPRFLAQFFLLTVLGNGGGRFEVLIMTVGAGCFGYYLLGRILVPLNSRGWRFWISPNLESETSRRLRALVQLVSGLRLKSEEATTPAP